MELPWWGTTHCGQQWSTRARQRPLQHSKSLIHRSGMLNMHHRTHGDPALAVIPPREGSGQVAGPRLAARRQCAWVWRRQHQLSDTVHMGAQTWGQQHQVVGLLSWDRGAVASRPQENWVRLISWTQHISQGTQILNSPRHQTHRHRHHNQTPPTSTKQDSAHSWQRPCKPLGQCNMQLIPTQLRDQPGPSWPSEQRAATNTTKRERLGNPNWTPHNTISVSCDTPPGHIREELFAANRSGQRQAGTKSRLLNTARTAADNAADRTHAVMSPPPTTGSPGPTTPSSTSRLRRHPTSTVSTRPRSTSAACRDELRSRGTIELLDRYTSINRIPGLKERLDALDMWWRFANGGSIGVKRLSEIVDVADVDGRHRRRRRPTASPGGEGPRRRGAQRHVRARPRARAPAERALSAWARR